MRAVEVTPPNLVMTNERFERVCRRSQAREAGVAFGSKGEIVFDEGDGR